MPFNIICNNIFRMEVDAIVNAANPELEQGGGVCGRIFAAAGVEEMAAACDAIDGCPTGEAVITPGFNLPAKFVIHTVGPVWQGGKQGEEALLRSAYRSSLELAAQYNLESVAFPLISSGSFRTHMNRLWQWPWMFDNFFETLHDRINLQDIKPLTNKDYFVRGSTALYDAVALGIHKITNV